MSREDAEHALEAFSKRVGIAPLRFDKSGTALLAFGEKQELIFYYAAETDQLQIWSPLNDHMLSGQPDADCALMRYLLEKNFPSTALQGAYFAIDRDMGVVLLGRSITIDVQNIDRLVDVVTAFAKQVLTIIAAIAGDVSDALAARRTSEVPDSDTPIIKA
ncbi:MAG: type III secretion system chaperone [Pseudomonadota bacterium]